MIGGKDLDTLQTAVIIVGMHRSGTSCLAGSLQQQGLFLGRVFEWNPHNLKGNRENEHIMLLNESVLATSSGSWDNPPTEITWNADQTKKRDDIIHDFVSNAEQIWGFKDPRAILTLPFWEDGLQNMRLVGTFRHPLHVANSLRARNNMSIIDALELWHTYNKILLSYIDKYDIPIVSFDVSQEEYLLTISNIAEHLGLGNQPAKAGSYFYDDSLISHKIVSNEDAIPGHVIRLFDSLRDEYRRQKP